jgi:hypothetical protein
MSLVDLTSGDASGDESWDSTFDSSDEEGEPALDLQFMDKHYRRGYILANVGARGLLILDQDRFGESFDGMLHPDAGAVGRLDSPDGRTLASVLQLPDDKYRLVVHLAVNDLPQAMSIALQFMPKTTQPAYLTSTDELAVCMHVCDLAVLRDVFVSVFYLLE